MLYKRNSSIWLWVSRQK